MMWGRHPAHRSSFSREFSVVPGRKSADFIESAGEPTSGCSETYRVAKPLRSSPREPSPLIAFPDIPLKFAIIDALNELKQGPKPGINSAVVVLSGIADEEDLLNRKLDQIRTETNLPIQGRYLGIEPEPVVDADGVQGLKVADVFPGSAAEKAGLHAGDVIHSINGYLTAKRDDLAWIMANAAPDGVVKMSVRTASDGKVHTITAQLAVEPGKTSRPSSLPPGAMVHSQQAGRTPA